MLGSSKGMYVYCLALLDVCQLCITGLLSWDNTACSHNPLSPNTDGMESNKTKNPKPKEPTLAWKKELYWKLCREAQQNAEDSNKNGSLPPKREKPDQQKRPTPQNWKPEPATRTGSLSCYQHFHFWSHHDSNMVFSISSRLNSTHGTLQYWRCLHGTMPLLAHWTLWSLS